MADPYCTAHLDLLHEKRILSSLHLLSFNDELFTYEQLSSLPSSCRDPIVCHHRRGHAIPMITPEMRSSLYHAAKGIQQDVGLTQFPSNREVDPLRSPVRIKWGRSGAQPLGDSMDLIASISQAQECQPGNHSRACGPSCVDFCCVSSFSPEVPHRQVRPVDRVRQTRVPDHECNHLLLDANCDHSARCRISSSRPPTVAESGANLANPVRLLGFHVVRIANGLQ